MGWDGMGDRIAWHGADGDVHNEPRVVRPAAGAAYRNPEPCESAGRGLDWMRWDGVEPSNAVACAVVVRSPYPPSIPQWVLGAARGMCAPTQHLPPLHHHHHFTRFWGDGRMPVTRIPNAEDPFGARHHPVFFNTWHAFPLHPPSSTTVGCWRRKGVGITTTTATAAATATATAITNATATATATATAIVAIGVATAIATAIAAAIARPTTITTLLPRPLMGAASSTSPPPLPLPPPPPPLPP